MIYNLTIYIYLFSYHKHIQLMTLFYNQTLIKSTFFISQFKKMFFIVIIKLLYVNFLLGKYDFILLCKLLAILFVPKICGKNSK